MGQYLQNYPPAGGTGTNGPNMSQMIMQMMARLTQGQNQLNQAMTEAMSQQLQINRNVERKAFPNLTGSLELLVLGTVGGTSSRLGSKAVTRTL